MVVADIRATGAGIIAGAVRGEEVPKCSVGWLYQRVLLVAGRCTTAMASCVLSA